MTDSILTSIKKSIGIEADYDVYDMDIIMNINTAFLTLKQLGIGPKEGYQIENASDTWSDFIDTIDNPESVALLSGVKTFIYLKVKTVFDPPASSIAAEAYKSMLNETEWRLLMENELKSE